MTQRSVVCDKENPVVILEPNYKGHRLSYANLIARYVLSQDSECYLASCSETYESAEYHQHMGKIASATKSIPLGKMPNKGLLKYHIWLIRHLSVILRRKDSPSVLILEGDKASFFISLAPFSIKKCTVLMMRAPQQQGSPKYMIRDGLKRFGMLVMKLRGARVFVLSPATFTAPTYEHLGYPAVPDPIDALVSDTVCETFKNATGIDSRNNWIGVFGHVSQRKNLDLIIASAGMMSPLPGILVAGAFAPGELERVSPDIENFRALGGVIILENRLLTDMDLNAAIASVNVVAIAHSSEGPSGILGKAVAIGVPVAASGALSLRGDIERLDAGYWWSLVPHDMAMNFEMAIQNGRLTRLKLANGTDFTKSLFGHI